MSLYNDNSCITIVDRRDHVQHLTVSKSYSDNCTCSLTEQNKTLKKSVTKHDFKNTAYNETYFDLPYMGVAALFGQVT